jgi:hypothetical protein
MSSSGLQRLVRACVRWRPLWTGRSPRSGIGSIAGRSHELIAGGGGTSTRRPRRSRQSAPARATAGPCSRWRVAAATAASDAGWSGLLSGVDASRQSSSRRPGDAAPDAVTTAARPRFSSITLTPRSSALRSHTRESRAASRRHAPRLASACSCARTVTPRSRRATAISTLRDVSKAPRGGFEPPRTD